MSAVGPMKVLKVLLLATNPLTLNCRTPFLNALKMKFPSPPIASKSTDVKLNAPPPTILISSRLGCVAGLPAGRRANMLGVGLPTPWSSKKLPTMAQRKTAQFNMRMDPELKEVAEKAAAADRRSLSSLIEKLLGCRVHGFFKPERKTRRHD